MHFPALALCTSDGAIASGLVASEMVSNLPRTTSFVSLRMHWTSPHGGDIAHSLEVQKSDVQTEWQLCVYVLQPARLDQGIHLETKETISTERWIICDDPTS